MPLIKMMNHQPPPPPPLKTEHGHSAIGPQKFSKCLVNFVKYIFFYFKNTF